MVAIAQAMDMEMGEMSQEHLAADWQKNPLTGVRTNIILLAYDTEGAEIQTYNPSAQSRTTEHGFAWLRLVDVVGVPPGRHGEDWHRLVNARHYKNTEFLSYENKLYLEGNREGFWTRFGTSSWYNPREGSAPFDALFKELAGDSTVGGKAVLSGATEDAKFPMLADVVAGFQQIHVKSGTIPFEQHDDGVEDKPPNKSHQSRLLQLKEAVSLPGSGATSSDDLSPWRKTSTEIASLNKEKVPARAAIPTHAAPWLRGARSFRDALAGRNGQSLMNGQSIRGGHSEGGAQPKGRSQPDGAGQSIRGGTSIRGGHSVRGGFARGSEPAWGNVRIQGGWPRRGRLSAKGGHATRGA